LHLEIHLTDKPEVVEGKTFYMFVARALDGATYHGYITKDEYDIGVS